ncbi:MAG: RNA polymerase sigma-70 factor [Chloroflexota bacterium]|nr:RNA polymerase sigma-70 factor [Chloroflexota bacterium]
MQQIQTERAEAFDRHRPLLFAIAYRMLGSVMDAEDLVQETFLRWQRAVEDGADGVRSPKAFLSAVITNLCIDHLRSARVQREQYVGPWLPEPLVTERELDVADAAALGESVSLAFLTLLERLTPVERAVFLLHDVFAYDFAEIAPLVGKSAANCRQLARRARAHIAAGRPRFDPSAERRERLTRQFVRACADGDLPALLATLADDITLWSDGGGKVNAARKPIHGADKVTRFLLGILRQAPPGMVVRPAPINGQPGFITYLDGRPYNALALDIVDGRIAAIWIVVNPDKLRALTDPRHGPVPAPGEPGAEF